MAECSFLKTRSYEFAVERYVCHHAGVSHTIAYGLAEEDENITLHNFVGRTHIGVELNTPQLSY